MIACSVASRGSRSAPSATSRGPRRGQLRDREGERGPSDDEGIDPGQPPQAPSRPPVREQHEQERQRKDPPWEPRPRRQPRGQSAERERTRPVDEREVRPLQGDPVEGEGAADPEHEPPDGVAPTALHDERPEHREREAEDQGAVALPQAVQARPGPEAERDRHGDQRERRERQRPADAAGGPRGGHGPGASRSHSDTWAGESVSPTTAVSSASRVPRSTSSRSRAANASSVRCASYRRR